MIGLALSSVNQWLALPGSTRIGFTSTSGRRVIESMLCKWTLGMTTQGCISLCSVESKVEARTYSTNHSERTTHTHIALVLYRDTVGPIRSLCTYRDKIRGCCHELTIEDILYTLQLGVKTNMNHQVELVERMGKSCHSKAGFFLILGSNRDSFCYVIRAETSSSR